MKFLIVNILKLNLKILFVLFISASQAIHPQEKTFKLLDNYLTNYIKNKNIPSISAGLYKDSVIIWSNAAGIADIEDNDPATKFSLYRIASITKPITAVAILQLWEKGLINLDIDVRTYIPSFPEKKWKFTIRQLLNHTAGIRGYKDGEFHNKKYFSSTNDAVKVFAYDSLSFEPGTKYEYTSLGYSLLALIIENVSNLSFEEYLNKNIFKPAEMIHTVIDKQRSIVPNRVKGYEKDSKRIIVNAPLADLSIKYAGGGLVSNAEDLLRFSNALLEGKLIKRSTFEIMIKQTKLKNGKVVDYGLGFAIESKNDSLYSISHTGGGTGFSTMLLIYPSLKLAAVHLINISDRNLDLPAKDIIEIFNSGLEIEPSKTLSDILMIKYLSTSIDSTVDLYNYINEFDSKQTNINEIESIAFAKDLLNQNKSTDAVVYLRNLLTRYPKSSNLTETLGDAFLQNNNKGLALKYYKITLQLNRNNQRVINLVKKLSSS